MVQMARPRGEIMAIQETEKVLQSERKQNRKILYANPKSVLFSQPSKSYPDSQKEKSQNRETVRKTRVRFN